MSLSADLLSLLREHSRDEQSFEILSGAFEALAHSEQGFRSLVEHSPDVIARYDQDLRHIYVNSRIQEITGKPPEFFIGKSNQDIYENLETLTPVEQVLLSVFLTGRERKFEFFSELTGKLRYYECRLMPEFNSRGTVETVMSVVHDITRRKLAEKTLRTQHRLNRVITDNLTDLVSWIDNEGRILYVTPSCKDFLGYEPEELLYTFFLPLIHADDIPELEKQLPAFAKSESIVTTYHRMRRKDGTYLWVESTVRGIFNEETGQLEGLISVTRDISERRTMEAQLARSERRFRRASDARPDAFLLLYAIRNEAGTIIDFIIDYVNKKAEQQFGRSTDEILGRSIQEIISEEDYRMFFPQYISVLETGQFQETEYHTPEDGRSYRRQVIPFGENGIAISRLDITAQKQTEQALLEQQHQNIALQKENELNALRTRIMTRISHEFRTPLSIIATSAEILEKYCDALTAEKRSAKFQRIHEQIEHIIGLLEDISLLVQNHQRKRRVQAAEFDLENLSCEIVDSIKLLDHAHHEISLTTTGDLQQVWGDPKMINAILTGLLSNAVKYSSPEQPVGVIVRIEDKEVILCVEDKGIGIARDDRERIFEPFYRGTNFDERPGLGLGLSIVRDTVDLYGGELNVSSQEGVGTMVMVRLPMLGPEN